jgi:hypothetical protein
MRGRLQISTSGPGRLRAGLASFALWLGLFALAVAAALALGACAGGTAIPTVGVPTGGIDIPTMPPDDFASGMAACIDAPTMAILDQLRATGADAPALLAANKDALIAGLDDLESSDTATNEWRDALLTALEGDDFDAAALEIAKLANDEVTITPC